MTNAYLVGYNNFGKPIKESLLITDNAYPLTPNKGERLVWSGSHYRVVDVVWDYDNFDSFGEKDIQVYVHGQILDEWGHQLLCEESMLHETYPYGDHSLHVCTIGITGHPRLEFGKIRPLRHKCFCGVHWSEDN